MPLIMKDLALQYDHSSSGVIELRGASHVHHCLTARSTSLAGMVESRKAKAGGDAAATTWRCCYWAVPLTGDFAAHQSALAALAAYILCTSSRKTSLAVAAL